MSLTKNQRRFIMKKFNLFITLLSSMLILTFTAASLAQDDGATQEKKQVQEQKQIQEQEQEQPQAQNKNEMKQGNTYQNQIQHGNRFQDKNGDGFNDNAPDHDGDGIPNGQDPDYDGAKMRAGKGKKGFVDENGNGINDNVEDWDGDGVANGKDPDFERPQDGTGRQNQYGKQSQNRTKTGRGGYGPGDGTGKSGVGPQDGSGYGPGSDNCDGTGPKGSTKRSGKK
jgi:hypothetical protein